MRVPCQRGGRQEGNRGDDGRDSPTQLHGEQDQRAEEGEEVGGPPAQSRQCQRAEENQGRQLAHKDANREIRQRIPCPYRAGVLCGEGPDVGDDESLDNWQPLPDLS